MGPEHLNRLKARGAIEDNWQETQRLFEKLKATGRCIDVADDDDDDDDDDEGWQVPPGIWFSLDDEAGKILIHDAGDTIGEWFSENKFFVLCMENVRRPFFKTPSVSAAYDQSVNLMNMPAEDRARFQSRMARALSNW